MAVSQFTASSMLDEMQVLSLIYAILEIRHDANGTVSWQGNPDDMGFSQHAAAFAAMGYGGFGALGHSIYHRELLPRLVEGRWTEEIYHIGTSRTHTAAITKSGELYIWGRDEGDGRLGIGPGRGPNEAGGLSIPSQVRALPMPVAAVSCGGFFTMA